MGIFRNHYITTYNIDVGTKLIWGCDCYNKYKDEKNFIEMIRNQKSYMACLGYKINNNRIKHTSIPIMIGSLIDYHIRGAEIVERDQIHWGSFILRGMFYIYTIFSTFNGLSLHVSETKGCTSVNIYTYCNNKSLAISFRNNVVYWSYGDNKMNSENGDMGWVTLLNESNKYTHDEQVTATEYLNLFQSMLSKKYNMNLLAHRQCLSGVAAINKYINYYLLQLNSNYASKKQTNLTLKEAFEKGSIYSAFGKNNSYENPKYFKTCNQTYNTPLHEGRSDKTEHLLPTVARVTNKAIQNSNALIYPKDAIGFFCVLNTKDMKSAGEQHVLVDDVIMTSETDDKLVYQYLKEKYHRLKSDGKYQLLLNSDIIFCRSNMTLEELIELKRKFPHVTTKYEYIPYIEISTRPSILIKYNEEYGCFFSPSEVNFFNMKIPEYALLSHTAKIIDIENLRRNQPAKNTVSVNNIKGSVAILNSEFHRKLMENSLGHTSYIEKNPKLQEAIYNCAVLETGCDTTNFERIYKSEIEPLLKCNEPYYPGDDEKKRKALLKLYDYKCLSKKLILDKKNTYKIEYDTSDKYKKYLEDYLRLIHGAKYFNVSELSHLKLWCSFGNIMGNTMEDGVVMDSETMSLLKEYVTYNTFITIDFIFENINQVNDSKFIFIDGDMDMYKDTLLGCLITQNQIISKNSTHTKIQCQKIGNHYYYLIHFLPNQHQTYKQISVRKIHNGKILTFAINGVYKADVCVGSKCANFSGQKNIISLPYDFGKLYTGITRDGRKVKTQLMYSEVGITSRVPTGQIFNMLNSPDLAIGDDGSIIAPLDLVLHTLHPFTNNKLFEIKNDTLTNINGFESQNLTNCSLFLRNNKSVKQTVFDLLGFHGFTIKFVNNIRSVYVDDSVNNSVINSNDCNDNDNIDDIDNDIDDDCNEKKEKSCNLKRKIDDDCNEKKEEPCHSKRKHDDTM